MSWVQCLRNGFISANSTINQRTSVRFVARNATTIRADTDHCSDSDVSTIRDAQSPAMPISSKMLLTSTA